jgi:hypothetical protein
VYDHGMISGLFKGEFDPSKGKSDLPSYIPLQSLPIGWNVS